MKTTVTIYDFHRFFQESQYKDNFSYEGRNALFNYLEEIDEDMEFDIVAICCDFTEHEYALECAEEYGFDSGLDEEDESRNLHSEALEWLRERTTVIEFDGGIIIQNF